MPPRCSNYDSVDSYLIALSSELEIDVPGLVPSTIFKKLLERPWRTDLEVAYILKSAGKKVGANINSGARFSIPLFAHTDEKLINRVVDLIELLGFEKAYYLLATSPVHEEKYSLRAPQEPPPKQP